MRCPLSSVPEFLGLGPVAFGVPLRSPCVEGGTVVYPTSETPLTPASSSAPVSDSSSIALACLPLSASRCPGCLHQLPGPMLCLVTCPPHPLKPPRSRPPQTGQPEFSLARTGPSPAPTRLPLARLWPGCRPSLALLRRILVPPTSLAQLEFHLSFV